MQPALDRSRWLADFAWLPTGLAHNVLIEQAGGRFVTVTPGSADRSAPRLTGLVLPGFANAHSHAFHRALRGRTHDGTGSFWTWRERMYTVAAQLDPDSYLALATACYAEMALAGVTAVGEFHYLHHAPGGRSYDDPNAMGHALREAARRAGIRLTLLDTCYLAGGLQPDGHTELDEVQRRFSDGDVDCWAQRVAALAPDAGMIIGRAAHSVRAVPRAALAQAAKLAQGQSPLHVHLSEQPAENASCQAFYGCSPTQLLHEQGFLATASTAVHATHLSEIDIKLLGSSSTGACFCPTTEKDLADGIGPARALHDAGVPLSLGSDQHAVIDMFEEARGLEMHERLSTGQRGRFDAADLVRSATVIGHRSIGWRDAGVIEPGYRADLVCVWLQSPRTAGVDPGQAVFGATAADVHTVIVDGSVVVQEGRHRLGDVGRLLAQAIEPLWDRP